ncbi:DUF1330 domain-containing protein [Undibacterium sp. Xuan67W]|uniref:DUF1330 domain-containing protein n=1 Tax=Undibacterium sp. Xuan67W TaxID=3413057 RepID=UPI003BF22E78
MSEVFVVAEIRITNPKSYADYLPLSTASVEKFGGEFLVRGGRRVQKEGSDELHGSQWRTVIVRFPDVDTASRWYDSQDYETARTIRIANSDGRLFFVEGI